MTPLKKYFLYVTIATVCGMYLVVGKLLPWIRDLGINSTMLEAAVSLVGAVGVYSLLSKLLVTLIDRVRIVKKIILGRDDLHGTWFGCFNDENGDKIWTVEHFEQDLDGLTIRGTGVRDDLSLFAKWTSDSCTIDSPKARLTYSYTCEIYDKKEDGRGVCVFHMERPNPVNRPDVIHGYSADLTDGDRTENREYRINDELLELEKAIEAGRKVMKEKNLHA